MNDREQFAAIMPGGEVGEVAADFGCCEIKLFRGWHFSSLYHKSTVVPAVNLKQKQEYAQCAG